MVLPSLISYWISLAKIRYKLLMLVFTATHKWFTLLLLCTRNLKINLYKIILVSEILSSHVLTCIVIELITLLLIVNLWGRLFIFAIIFFFMDLWRWGFFNRFIRWFTKVRIHIRHLNDINIIGSLLLMIDLQINTVNHLRGIEIDFG